MNYLKGLGVKLSVLALLSVAFFGYLLFTYHHTAHAQLTINTAAALDAAQSRLQAIQGPAAECRLRLMALSGADANFFENQPTYDALKERYSPYRELVVSAGRNHGVDTARLMSNIHTSLFTIGKLPNEGVGWSTKVNTFNEGLDSIGYNEQFFENISCLINLYNAQTDNAGTVNPADVFQCQAAAFEALHTGRSGWSKISDFGQDAANMQSELSELADHVQLILDEPAVLRGYTQTAKELSQAHSSLLELKKLVTFDDSSFKQFVIDGMSILSNNAIPRIENPEHLKNLQLLHETGTHMLELTSHVERAVNTCLDTTKIGDLQSGYTSLSDGQFELYANVPDHGFCQWNLTVTNPDNATRTITSNECRIVEQLQDGANVSGTVRAVGSLLTDTIDFIVQNFTSTCTIRDIEPGDDGVKRDRFTVENCLYAEGEMSFDAQDLPPISSELVNTLEICTEGSLTAGVFELGLGPFCKPLSEVLALLQINLNPNGDDSDDSGDAGQNPPSNNNGTTNPSDNSADDGSTSTSPPSTPRPDIPAVPGECPPGDFCFTPATSFCTVNGLVDVIINWAIRIGSVVAAGMVVYAGILYMTAAGNSMKVAQASKVLAFVAVGVMILFLSKGLVVIIQNTVGVGVEREANCTHEIQN